ncbi:MAG: hypothetical protein ABIA63_01930, partial [bacterium]
MRIRNIVTDAALPLITAAALLLAGCSRDPVAPPSDNNLILPQEAYDLCKHGILMLQALQGMGRLSSVNASKENKNRIYTSLEDTLREFFNPATIIGIQDSPPWEIIKAKPLGCFKTLVSSRHSPDGFFKLGGIYPIDSLNIEQISDTLYSDLQAFHLKSNNPMSSLIDSVDILCLSSSKIDLDNLLKYRSYLTTEYGRIIHQETKASSDTFIIDQSFLNMSGDTLLSVNYKAVYISLFPDTFFIYNYTETSDTSSRGIFRDDGKPFIYPPQMGQNELKVWDTLNIKSYTYSFFKKLAMANVFNNALEDSIILFSKTAANKETVTVSVPDSSGNESNQYIYYPGLSNFLLQIKHKVISGTKKWSRNMGLAVMDSLTSADENNLALLGFIDSITNTDHTVIMVAVMDSLQSDSAWLFQYIKSGNFGKSLLEYHNIDSAMGLYRIKIKGNPILYENYEVISFKSAIYFLPQKSVFNSINFYFDYAEGVQLFSSPSSSPVERMTKTYLFSEIIRPPNSTGLLNTPILNRVSHTLEIINNDTISRAVYYFSDGDSINYSSISNDSLLLWTASINNDTARVGDSLLQYDISLSDNSNTITNIHETIHYKKRTDSVSHIIRIYYNGQNPVITDNLSRIGTDTLLITRENTAAALPDTLGFVKWQNGNLFSWADNPGFHWNKINSGGGEFSYKGALQS